MAKRDMVQKGMKKVADVAISEDGTVHPAADSTMHRLLSVQRPVVLAYVRMLRRRHPEASVQEIADIIAKHYITITTGGGAAVGASAVVPGIGTAAALGISTVETAGFLESSALYAQAIAELHNLAVEDRMRANALVMGLMLGSSGEELVRKFSSDVPAEHDDTSASLTQWGSTVVRQIPSNVMGGLVKRMRKVVVRKFAARVGGSMLGRILPFGIGAVVGGVANRKMAQSIVANSVTAFGELPDDFPPELSLEAAHASQDKKMLRKLRNILRLNAKHGRTDEVLPSAEQEGTGVAEPENPIAEPENSATSS